MDYWSKFCEHKSKADINWILRYVDWYKVIHQIEEGRCLFIISDEIAPILLIAHISPYHKFLTQTQVHCISNDACVPCEAVVERVSEQWHIYKHWVDQSSFTVQFLYPQFQMDVW